MSEENRTHPSATAYPNTASDFSDPTRGLSKREYFAALAMQGLLANAATLEDLETWHEVGEAAVEAADALIAALNKGGGA